MIFGSLLPGIFDTASQWETLEIEKRAASGMLASLEPSPQKSHALTWLTSRFGFCVLAALSDTESAPAELIPSLGGLTISADARLDNRAELITTLGLDPADSSNLKDAVLILLAYQKWGDACASYLLGDFAFAIWDERAGVLFCARDTAGTRPFYYHYAPGSGRFIFSSDLTGMAAHPRVPLRPNLAYVLARLQTTTGGFEHPEYTYYQDIQKLPPAHCLTLSSGRLRRWAYWQPGQTVERRYPQERDYVEELVGLLTSAVTCRVAGSQPVGAHISGGLDSSSVAVLAQRVLKKQGGGCTGFCWAPPPEGPLAELPPGDERRLVEDIRAAEGLPVHYIRLSAAAILAHARRDASLYPSASLVFEIDSSQTAADLGIRRLLSGWGGDELAAFNGRGYLPSLFRRGQWQTLQRELSLFSRRYGGSTSRKWLNLAVMPWLPAALLRRLDPTEYQPTPPLPVYLRPEFAAALTGVQPLERPEISERQGVRGIQMALLQNGHLSYRMEAWASRGARLGITYAYPLLDRRLVEFALSIPEQLYFKDGWRRYLYRTAMAGILPDNLRWKMYKDDPALMDGAQAARSPELREQLKAQLLARAGNPYVDVEKLVANPAVSSPEGTGFPNPGPGQAVWLAFAFQTTREVQA